MVLDLAMMVAGTKYRGQFEERIKAVMNSAQAKNVVLFIDELHWSVRAVRRARSTRRTCSRRRWRGEIQCIGATTFDVAASTSRRTQPSPGRSSHR
ncbi:MAG: AAA family ATPase [Phycisphaerales bacterium]